jgi:hypothetical protein
MEAAITPAASAPAASLSALVRRTSISKGVSGMLISARAMMLRSSCEKTVQLGRVSRENRRNQLE